MSEAAEAPHHWRLISKEPTVERPALVEEIAADVAVVGAGFTGLAAALELAERGASVVVLEQDRVGQAASGRNNGQVIPHHSRHGPREIEALLGSVRGERYNAMVASAATQVFALAARHAIACDGAMNGWIQAAHSSTAQERLRLYHAEWQAFGAAAEWLDQASLAERVGSTRFLGGWQAAQAGHLNPYALAQGLARAATTAGARLHEQSSVQAIEPDGKGWRVATGRGAVRAGQVLIASNALTGRFWSRLAQALIPVKVYQVATRPLTGNLRRSILPGNQGVSDMRRDIHAFRYDAEGGLASVGTHTVWHDAEARGRAAVLRRLQTTFPQLGDIGAVAYWEGVLAVVPDRLPRLMRLAPGVVFAGVYSGRGVALSLSLGPLVARWLAGTIAEDALPLPVTGLRTIPGHALAVRAAALSHPWHRLLDRVK